MVSACYDTTAARKCRPMINKPCPFKGLNIRIPIRIPIREGRLLIRGPHYVGDLAGRVLGGRALKYEWVT